MSEEAGEYKISQKPVVNPPSEKSMKLMHDLMMAPDVGAGARHIDEIFAAAAAADRSEIELLTEIRKNLHRWRSRYAESAHAKQHVKETSLLIERIDERLLAL